jgi:Entner-Doudoroff aldolase
VIGQLLDAGLVHQDVTTVMGEGGLARYRQEPYLDASGGLAWRDAPKESRDTTVIAPASAPFSGDGGLKVLTGNLGRAVIKTSAVAPEHRVVEAPAMVFETQEAVMHAFKGGLLNRDAVVVVRYQGPRANGMPELHKLTPILGVMQDEGHHVALVTDGRMSGASGQDSGGDHVTPECVGGGPLAKVRDGDIIRLDSNAGRIDALVPDAEWNARTIEKIDLRGYHHGIGRELFGVFRSTALGAEQGAMSFVTREAAESIPVSPHRFPSTTSSSLRRPDAMQTIEVMRIGPVIPVIVVDDLAQAVPLARALVAGGVRVLEVTLRTPVALEAIRAMAASVADAIVGVGTITRPEDFAAAQAAGAVFGVSPGLTPALIEAQKKSGLPLLPGCMTPSDVVAARAAGFTELKLFPAQQAGGVGMLKALGSVFRRRDVLPDGRRHRGKCAGIPRAVQRRVCRRLVADAEGRGSRGRLGTHYRARARRVGAQAREMKTC